ncbi:MAG TPA: hypothetical protein VH600_23490 [Burkholderiales bacterium]|jgi:hypothetical protein
MRNIKVAAIPAAILFLGIISVTACSPRPSQPEALPVVQTPTPSLGSVYFPAQYVNQGKDEEPIQDFY